MLTQVMLPWWGWAYLLFVLTIFIAGFFADKSLDSNEIIGSSLSLFSICVFVIGFFNPEVIAFLGYFIIPMTILGIYWEFTTVVRETGKVQAELADDPELTEDEQTLLINIAMAVNALVVVPGYVLGIVLCFNLLGFN